MKDQVKWYYRFHIGKKARSIFDYAKLGTVLDLGIGALSLLPGVDRREAFNFIDSIQRRTNSEFLNDYIIQDPEFLSYRVDRTLEQALSEYKKNHGTDEQS